MEQLLPYQSFLRIEEWNKDKTELIQVHDGDGKYPDGIPNSLILPGKLYLGTLLTSAASGGFIYMCVGASATPVIDQENDDRLGGTASVPGTAHEYIGNPSRKQLMSVLNAGQPLMNYTSDWVAETITISGITYHAKAVGTCTFSDTDLNNGTGAGNPFRRWGINTIGTLPATVTSKSGTMLNEIIDVSDVMKHANNQVIVYLTIRI